MHEDELAEGVEMVVSNAPPGYREPLGAALFEALTGPVRNQDFGAIVRDLTGAGGYAFKWEDVMWERFLALGDLVDAVGSILAGFPPNESAKLLVALLGVWMRLRQVRAPLTKEQFMILRAVKKRCQSLDEIVAATKLDLAVVSQNVNALLQQRYGGEMPLLERINDKLTTPF